MKANLIIEEKNTKYANLQSNPNQSMKNQIKFQ